RILIHHRDRRDRARTDCRRDRVGRLPSEDRQTHAPPTKRDVLMFVYGFEAALSRKRVVASTRQPAVTRELEYLEEALSAHAKQAEWRMNPKAPGSRRLEAGRRPVQSVRTPIRLSRSFKWRAPGTCAAFAAATAS